MGRKGWARTALALAFLVVPASAYANDPPSCQTDPPFQLSVFENGSVGLSFPCTDPDGDRLTYTNVAAAHGTITGTTYQAKQDYNGTDTVTFTASDGTNTTPGSLEVVVYPVDSAPRASADSAVAQSAVELSVAAPGVLGNDVEPDGQSMTAALVSGPSHGTLALAADGGYRYTAATGYVGNDHFTYRASDGNLTADATVTIAVGNTSPACPA